MNPIKILFVCHGNICRSPMAQFVMTHLVKEAGLEKHFIIDSKATSTEEIGNSPYPPVKRKMQEEGISMVPHKARQITKSDYEEWDYIIGMDSNNIRNMTRILGPDTEGKIYKLLSFADSPADIADPWYTDDFDTTFNDVLAGCKGLLNLLSEKGTV